MDQLKLIAQALGIELDSPVEKIVAAVADLQKKADKSDFWQKEATDNLAKLERTNGVFQANAELRADSFMTDAVHRFKISTAEAETLKKMFMRDEQGEALVRTLIAQRPENDYLTRKASLGHSDPPSDPLVELESRVKALMTKDSKLTRGAAMVKVQSEDPEFAERYRLEIVKGAKGGDR